MKIEIDVIDISNFQQIFLGPTGGFTSKSFDKITLRSRTNQLVIGSELLAKHNPGHLNAVDFFADPKQPEFIGIKFAKTGERKLSYVDNYKKKASSDPATKHGTLSLKKLFLQNNWRLDMPSTHLRFAVVSGMLIIDVSDIPKKESVEEAK